MGEKSNNFTKSNIRQNKMESNEELMSNINKWIQYKEESISANRFKTNISHGIWRQNERLVEMITEKNINNYMGFMSKSVKYLNPFEALFLMESDSIQITYEDIPLSIEEAFQLFFNNEYEMDLYRVYAILSRIGYYVKIHPKCDSTSESVESVVSCKRNLDNEDIESQYECSKHLSVDQNYYELSSQISNYKSMVNIRKLNKDLLPKSLSMKTLNERVADSSKEDQMQNSEHSMTDNELSLCPNPSIIYDIEDNETSVELDSSLYLFKGSVKPLCSLATAMKSDELYELIQSYGPKCQKSNAKTCSEFTFGLDVYKADNKLDESPLFHVVVTQAKQAMPQIQDIIYLRENSRAKQFYFAVIDSGNVNFYSISEFDLNNEFPVLWEKYLEPLTPHSS